MGSRPLPELGILFMPSMVRAILAGEKRVTRRAMKPPKAVEGDPWCAAGPFVRDRADLNDMWFEWTRGWAASFGGSPWVRERSRYGPPGRRLWVRETWRPWVRGWSTHVQYRADGKRGPSLGAAESDACMAIAETNGGHWDDGRGQNPETVKWRPSLLMPRWASRLTLCVTEVRAERLTKITAEDVALEGLPHAGLGDTPADYCRVYREMHGLDADADPWVWRIAFEVVDAG